MFKKILLSALLLLIAAYIVAAVTVFNRKPASQVCQDIRLVIKDSVYAGFITKNEVSAMLKKKGISPLEQPMDRVRTDSIEQVLSRHPLIDRVECYKTPSGSLNIEVSQRIPILRVMSDGWSQLLPGRQGPHHAPGRQVRGTPRRCHGTDRKSLRGEGLI